MKYINRFFWWCAGANIEILEKSPTDHSKYFGLGGTILFTAMMASFAGGYAFYTAFDDVTLSFLFGGFWGAMIFNLDRFIISSTGKGDGTVKITKEEWQNSFPRIVLAVIIGFVIAVPLELKVFEKEIGVEINKIINEERKSIKGGLTDIRDEIQRKKNQKIELDNELKKIEERINDGDPIIGTKEEKIKLLKSLKASKEKRFREVNPKYLNGKSRYHRYKKKLEEINESDQYVDEATIKEYERKRYLGKIERNKYAQEVKRLRKEISTIDNQLLVETGEKDERKDELLDDFTVFQDKTKLNKERIDKEIVDLENTLSAKEKEADDTAVQFDGFMAQLIALDRLSVRADTVYKYQSSASSYNAGDDSLAAPPTPTMSQQISSIEESYTPVFYAKWMISILLICIEIAPILFKMMTESGSYDDRLEEIRYHSEISKRKYISDINQQINMELKLSNEMQNNKVKAELLANEELLSSIAMAQAEIAQKAIDAWKNEQLQKVASNPNLMVKTGIT